MKTNHQKKTSAIQIQLLTEDYAKIKQQQQNSTCRSMAQYVRNTLLNKPIITFYRDQSLDDLIEEIAVLNNEMNTLKSKLPEIIEKLDQHPQSKELDQSLNGFEQAIQELGKKIEELKTQIQKITDKWLQS